VIALVCVADRNVGLGFVVAAAVAAVVAGAGVVDAVAGYAAVAVAVVIAIAAVAVVVGPVVFVARNQPPHKKIRRGQRSRCQTPVNEKIFHAIAYIYIIHVFLFIRRMFIRNQNKKFRGILSNQIINFYSFFILSICI